ncbi:phosphoglycerate mutase 1-like, partial [Diaphorina citri]|uniref:phosphoglycerate mutase (2,3-diphosphoglycerate-dependent) n=1 Tax=Diaphorina citri TaxID=121845 RepID=A0A1S3DT38_DIACI
TLGSTVSCFPIINNNFARFQVQIWRRSYDVLPPPMTKDHKYYQDIITNPNFKIDGPNEDQFPHTESLKETIMRVLPYWNENIATEIKQGKKVLVVTHGTSLRGLVKHIERKSLREPVQIWRRSYDVLPPPMTKDHKYYQDIISNPNFKIDGPNEDQFPHTESLKETIMRVLPYWNENIATEIKQGKKVLVVTHGTSLRGLVKHIE